MLIGMRVIAGKYRSRPLAAPAGMDTRPTADRLRETLFNVLTQGARNWIDGGAVLDLYAGSGAVGIEALSRGAARVVFVENNARALAVLAANLKALRVAAGAVVERRQVGSFLVREVKRIEAENGPEGAPGMSAAFDVVFLDPPYELAEEYAATLGLLGGRAAGLLAEGAVVVAEHRRKAGLAERYGALVRWRVKEQGDAGLSFFSVRESS